MRLVLPLLLLAPMAAAQPASRPMTPAEFEAFATGRTLSYSVDGRLWGSETYFPDRRVLDADTGGPCRTGRWYPDGDAVCFVYDGSDRRHCWLYWREGDAVMARPLDAAPGSTVQSVAPAAAPLTCAPAVGV